MALRMALRSISANKMRSMLTMLGIIIGVFSLVVLVSLVSSTTNSIADQVSGLGSSLITVSVSDSRGRPIHLEDLEDWIDSEEAISAMSPAASAMVQVRCGEKSALFTLNGVTGDYAEISGLKLLHGRFLKRSDLLSATRVCVLDRQSAETLVGYDDCVGAVISLGGNRFTVVGVTESEESLASFFNMSLTAYLPFSTLYRTTDSVSAEITAFTVGPAEGFTVAAAESRMKELLLERFGDEDACRISSQNIFEDAMKNVTSVLTILLGGIAAISLIVGGVGIMNIMLVTVTERTREIGIRKAIGASRRTILVQFLIEAVVLCMLGCALGVFFSWAVLRLASLIVVSMESLRFRLEPSVVILSAAFCFAIGVIFGLYPANKAARMKPIDALHYGG